MSVNTDAAVKKILSGSLIQSGLMQAKMVDVLSNFMEEQVNMYNDPSRSIRKVLKTKYKDDQEWLKAMNKISSSTKSEKDESSKTESEVSTLGVDTEMKEGEEVSKASTSRQLPKGKAPTSLKVKRDPKAEKDALTSLLGQ